MSRLRFKKIRFFRRSCNSSAITEHWCTCSPYKNNDKNDEIVKRGVKFVIDLMNSELNEYSNGSYRLCAELKLKTISYARKAEYQGTDKHNPYDVYMFVFEASPSGGIFEATVKYAIKGKTFELTGSVSRLNMYASQSGCIKKDNLKKFCYCLKSPKG